jgi:hypothetical protein
MAVQENTRNALRNPYDEWCENQAEGAFRVSLKRAEKIVRRKQRLRNRQRRIERRLEEKHWTPQAEPMFSASNIQYEVAGRSRALGAGGIGLMHKLARQTGLIDGIDRELELLKIHLPYHESDHVLNIAYNILAGGHCLDDLELLRNDEVYLDALGAQRIPDPTTAGDFCRRFDEPDIETLMEVINRSRLKVWAQQPDSFFDEAILDADGTVAPTTGECKQGMDMSYKGEWGYHPLLISLANTQEPLYLVNRSGNRPSSEGAAARFDQAISLCREAGFRRVTLRGDTDFSQTRFLDGWSDRGVRVVFGIQAAKTLVEQAEELPGSEWNRLERPPRMTKGGESRSRPARIKERIVEERGYLNIELETEDVASYEYTPTACEEPYRIVAVRKNLRRTRGQHVLFREKRYFFYITNDRESESEEIVFLANKRCNQENLIEQLKNGVKAMTMPSNTLLSNWAYMVMASLAWTLKAWFALLLPESGRWKEKHRAEKTMVLRMDFKRFLAGFLRIPAQLVLGGRRQLFRLLSWNPYLHIFLRADEALSLPMKC